MMLEPTVLDILDYSSQSPNAYVDEHIRRPGMASTTKQKLRPWLEGQLNRGEIEGVEWLDREKKIFKLPWKHGGKSDWSPVDSELFKAWARNTGKYREGQDKEEYAKWKTRVRCALNKANDIRELKDRHGIDEPKPYKVYQFLPKRDSRRSEVPNIGLTDEEIRRLTSDEDTLPLGDGVPVLVNDYTAPPQSLVQEIHTPYTTQFRQPQEVSTSSLLGTGLGSIWSAAGAAAGSGTGTGSNGDDIMMSGLEDGRLPSDLRSLPSGDLILNSMRMTDYLSMEMEIDVDPPAPDPMPSYDQISTDPSSFPTNPATGEPEFTVTSGGIGMQQPTTTNVMMQTSTGPVQLPSNVQLRFQDAAGNLYTCTASQFASIVPQLQQPINILGQFPDISDAAMQPAEEEPQSESINLDHAYLDIAAPLVNLDTYLFRGFEMRVTLYYFGNVLFERDLLHPQGYCFHYGCDSKIEKKSGNMHLGPQFMGPDTMHRCPFPDVPQHFAPIQKQNIQTVLDGLERGFTVYCQEGNIYLTRYCKTRVFVSTTEQRNSEHSLSRQMTNESFNWKRYSERLNNQSIGNLKPDPTVYIGLGQRWNFGKRNDTCAITMKIVCSKALQICNRITGFEENLFIVDRGNSTPMPYEISKSNEIDRLMQKLKEQNIRSPPQS